MPEIDRETPEGFDLLTGAAGALFLACHDELASSYAIRVVSGATFEIARRVPSEALAAVAGADSTSVVWYLGVNRDQRQPFRIVVHRPFGTILEF